MNLIPPDDGQLLVFFVSLLVILVVARLLGALMRRFGQPGVIGELGAGLVLGPSVLGRVWPEATAWLFPADPAQNAMLFTVGWLGVMFLLVATGFETDLGLIRRLGRAAATVSTGSLVIPLAVGFVIGWVIPEAFVGESTDREVFALFIAAALSISSLPVISKILTEMGLLRRNFGQLTLAAGMANDVVGWILLGFVVGFAQAGSLRISELVRTLVGVVLFFVVSFTIGQRVVDHSLRRVRLRGDHPVEGMTVVLVTTLVFGVATQWLHVEAVLGAFLAGVILARSRFAENGLIRPLETMTSALFAPVFFATAGLRVDLGLLADAQTLLWALIVLAGASASKFVGAVLGARLGSLTTREGIALGIGLNARGALEIVIAALGLTLGVLNDRSYAIVVLMAMATSMAAPPLLRGLLRNFEGTPRERERLDREAILAGNTLVTDERVLLPTRGDVASLLAAQVVGLSWPDDATITLVTVGQQDLDLRPFHEVLHGKQIVHLRLDGDDPVEAVLAESRVGYGVLVVGTASTASTEGAISPFIDKALSRVSIPTVVVRLPGGHRDRLPWAFGRAVVPVTGSASSRAGAELASHLSSAIGTRLHFLHVNTNPTARMLPDIGQVVGILHVASTGRQVLDEAADRADRIGANHVSEVRHAGRAGSAILDSLNELDADLLVLSTVRRGVGGDVPRLGNTVQHLLSGCTTTTLLVVLPEDG